jgi:hypothetical protein
VIDQISGINYSRMLTLALGRAKARGDHQLIVVTAETDSELVDTVTNRGFEQPIIPYATY